MVGVDVDGPFLNEDSVVVARVDGLRALAGLRQQLAPVDFKRCEDQSVVVELLKGAMLENKNGRRARRILGCRKQMMVSKT